MEEIEQRVKKLLRKPGSTEDREQMLSNLADSEEARVKATEKEVEYLRRIVEARKHTKELEKEKKSLAGKPVWFWAVVGVFAFLILISMFRC